MSDGVTPLNAQQTAQQESIASYNNYFIRVWIAFDMFLNVLFGGNLGETISARTGRSATKGNRFAILLAKFLNLFQKDHTAKAVADNYKYAQEVSYLENISKIIDAE